MKRKCLECEYQEEVWMGDQDGLPAENPHMAYVCHGKEGGRGGRFTIKIEKMFPCTDFKKKEVNEDGTWKNKF